MIALAEIDGEDSIRNTVELHTKPLQLRSDSMARLVYLELNPQLLPRRAGEQWEQLVGNFLQFLQQGNYSYGG